MSGTLLPLAFAVPIAAAAVAAAGRDRLGVRRAILLATTAAELGFAAALIAETSGGRVLVAQLGGFPAPFAIAMAADLFSSLMLFVSALMVFVCTMFAAARGEDRREYFHTLVLVLLSGITLSFLTADLFNLFVAFEVMLIASYVLITLGGTRGQVRGGSAYVMTNLLASTLFLLAVALLYGEVGSVNFAELGAIARTTPSLAIPGSLLFVAFAVKTGLVPVHGWLPSAYPSAPPAIAALFSGLLTKVGIYAMYRVYAMVFEGNAAFRPMLLAAAAATMVVAVLGALGSDEFRRILSFHITSQIGYMLMGLGLFTTLGLAGGIFYILHHIVVKTSLFLVAGVVETLTGTGTLSRVGGMARRHAFLASTFAVSALSLAGLPPLSGFFAKFVLVRAAFEEAQYAVAVVAIVVGLLTLASMVKIWTGVFWGADPLRDLGKSDAGLAPVAGGAPEAEDVSDPPVRIALVAPAAILAALSVAIGFGAEGLYLLAERAAEGLIDTSGYVRAVLGR